MARARIRPRISGGPLYGGGGTRYTFGNPQAEMDQAGARSLDETYHDTLAQEQHAASRQYQQMHAELEAAKLRRELAQDEAKVQRRIKYETMMEKAIPELYAIDPADPQAVQKRAQFAQRWPQLFHKENDIPGITSEFEQHNRLSGEAERQRNEIAAKKEAAELRDQSKKEALDLRERDKKEADDRRKQDLEERDRQRKQDLRENHLGYARGKYDTAEEESTILGKRIKENQGYIDAIKAEIPKGKSPDADQEHQLNLLVKSQDELKAEKARHDSKMKGLVSQFPELDPTYVPKEETAGAAPGAAAPAGETKAPGTPLSPIAVDTATPPPATAAPIARGTATPSGEMDTSGSTNGTQTPQQTVTFKDPLDNGREITFPREEAQKILDGYDKQIPYFQDQKDTEMVSRMTQRRDVMRAALGGDKPVDVNAPATTTPVAPAVAAAPAPHPADPEWDSITAQMQTANGNAEAARARRLAAMDIIAKAKPTDYLNPFDKTIENAQKEIEEASNIADQHDATYKELFDKRGALLQKPAAPAPVAAVTPPVTPPAAVAPAIPNVGVSAVDGGLAGAVSPVAAVPVDPAAPAEPHPYEGVRVKQKSTGRYGTFKNGQFVSEEDEQMQDQPTA